MATITIEGNLTKDLTLTIAKTAEGTDFAYGRIAENRRKRNPDGSYSDDGVIYHNIALFGRLALNASESFRKGDTVLIVGELEPNDYTNGDGDEIETKRIAVRKIGASLTFATVEITKNTKAS